MERRGVSTRRNAQAVPPPPLEVPPPTIDTMPPPSPPNREAPVRPPTAPPGWLDPWADDSVRDYLLGKTHAQLRYLVEQGAVEESLRSWVCSAARRVFGIGVLRKMVATAALGPLDGAWDDNSPHESVPRELHQQILEGLVHYFSALLQKRVLLDRISAKELMFILAVVKHSWTNGDSVARSPNTTNESVTPVASTDHLGGLLSRRGSALLVEARDFYYGLLKSPRRPPLVPASMTSPDSAEQLSRERLNVDLGGSPPLNVPMPITSLSGTRLDFTAPDEAASPEQRATAQRPAKRARPESVSVAAAPSESRRSTTRSAIAPAAAVDVREERARRREAARSATGRGGGRRIVMPVRSEGLSRMWLPFHLRVHLAFQSAVTHSQQPEKTVPPLSTT